MMPYVSLAQEHFFHSPGAKRAGISKKMVKEWDRATKGRKLPAKKKKTRIVINNKLKGDYGAMNPKTNKVEINVKAHRGDKAELASTIKHELMHVKHPKMTEKQVYKKTAKTKIPEMEQHKLIAKLRNKKINYKLGAAKRRFKLGRGEQKPGEFINRLKVSSPYAKGVAEKSDKTQIGIRGLI